MFSLKMCLVNSLYFMRKNELMVVHLFSFLLNQNPLTVEDSMEYKTVSSNIYFILYIQKAAQTSKKGPEESYFDVLTFDTKVNHGKTTRSNRCPSS